jgi:hypothetical protein
VNAQEKAIGLDVTVKIAAVVNLFKAEFPDAMVDFKPWCSDPDTQEWIDPHSIDLGFHFPGWSRRLQSNSILVQLRFSQDFTNKLENLIGLEVAGFNHQGMAWQVSTVDDWQFFGQFLPGQDYMQKIKNFCRQVFTLFKI